MDNNNPAHKIEGTIIVEAFASQNFSYQASTFYLLSKSKHRFDDIEKPFRIFKIQTQEGYNERVIQKTERYYQERPNQTLAQYLERTTGKVGAQYSYLPIPQTSAECFKRLTQVTAMEYFEFLKWQFENKYGANPPIKAIREEVKAIEEFIKEAESQSISKAYSDRNTWEKIAIKQAYYEYLLIENCHYEDHDVDYTYGNLPCIVFAFCSLFLPFLQKLILEKQSQAFLAGLKGIENPMLGVGEKFKNLSLQLSKNMPANLGAEWVKDLPFKEIGRALSDVNQRVAQQIAFSFPLDLSTNLQKQMASLTRGVARMFEDLERKNPNWREDLKKRLEEFETDCLALAKKYDALIVDENGGLDFDFRKLYANGKAYQSNKIIKLTNQIKPRIKTQTDIELDPEDCLERIHKIYEEVKQFDELKFLKLTDDELIQHIVEVALNLAKVTDESINRGASLLWSAEHQPLHHQLPAFKNRQQVEPLHTNTKALIYKLKKHSFFELRLVSCLSEEGRNKIFSQLAGEDLPYQIAMLDFLAFTKYLLKEYCNTTKALFKTLADILGANERAVKGNYYVLNPKSNENKERYTAHLHIETVKTYYQTLK